MAQASDGEDDQFENVDEALEFLETLTIGKGLNRSAIVKRVDQAIVFLSQVSSTRGLIPDDLERLVNVIKLKYHQLGARRTLRLVKCLIPSTVVPEKAILKIISLLCSNKVPKYVKTELFKWILAVYCYDTQASKSKIQSIYDIVFCFVFDSDVCKFASHLLYIITRKKDVTRSRVRQLIQLNKNSNKPYIVGLLCLYQVYRVELLRILPSGRRIFRPPTNWKHCFQKVKRNNIELEMGPFMKHCGDGVVNKCSIDLDRERETYVDYHNMMTEVDSKYSVGEIVSSKNRRQIFSSYRGDLLRLRMENWIQVAGFDFCLAEDKIEFGVQYLENMAESLKELPKENLDGRIFLQEYSSIWDGVKNQNMIFSFISTLDIYEFDIIHESVLEDLEMLFFTGSTAYQCKYIQCLNDLCNNWILYKLPMFADFDEETFQEGKTSVEQLLLYINILCSCVLTQEERPNCLLITAVLEFYNDTLRLAILGLSTFVVWAQPILIYVSLFSFSTFIVSELCTLMINYQKAISLLKNKTSVDAKQVERINSYIIDISSCLWRGTAYEYNEKSLLFKQKFLPIEVSNTVQNSNKSFSFYKHPAFVIFTFQFLQARQLSCEFEDVQNVIALREQFLEFLDRPECKGLLNFFLAFIDTGRRLC